MSVAGVGQIAGPIIRCASKRAGIETLLVLSYMPGAISVLPVEPQNVRHTVYQPWCMHPVTCEKSNEAMRNMVVRTRNTVLPHSVLGLSRLAKATGIRVERNIASQTRFELIDSRVVRAKESHDVLGSPGTLG